MRDGGPAAPFGHWAGRGGSGEGGAADGCGRRWGCPRGPSICLQCWWCPEPRRPPALSLAWGPGSALAVLKTAVACVDHLGLNRRAGSPSCRSRWSPMLCDHPLLGGNPKGVSKRVGSFWWEAGVRRRCPRGPGGLLAGERGPSRLEALQPHAPQPDGTFSYSLRKAAVPGGAAEGWALGPRAPLLLPGFWCLQCL